LTHSLAQRLGSAALAGILMVAMSGTGLAAEPPAPAQRPAAARLLASGQKHVQQAVKRNTPAPARAAQQGGGFDEPGSFFRTKRGVAVLVMAAAGIGYVWYSAFNDRIHSQARERLDQ
jgi:hypothetical protein